MKIKLYFVASFLYSAFILTLSLINLKKVEIIKMNASDKLYHGVCYALMAFLWCLYFGKKLKPFDGKQKIKIAFAIIAYGIIIEYLQLYLTNYRSFDWWDALANTIGVIIGTLIYYLLQKQFNI